MAKFFIDRPIFAWVIALFILVVGGVAITQLPIAQYPPVAPPSIVVAASYPGASAKTLEDSVLSVIEREMNGATGLIYMESVAQANGSGNITLSFEPGTNPALAQVDVQNRLSRATPRLPQAVTQQGVRVDKSNSNFLLFAILSSDNPAVDPIALGDYASRNVVPELQRLTGIGQAQLFGTERAMRIWIDPAKMAGFALSSTDVTNAIRAQNAQISSGTIGDLPNVAGQGIAATVVSMASSPVWRGKALPPRWWSMASSPVSSNSATSCCGPKPMAPRFASRMLPVSSLVHRRMQRPRVSTASLPLASACN